MASNNRKQRGQEVDVPKVIDPLQIMMKVNKL